MTRSASKPVRGGGTDIAIIVGFPNIEAGTAISFEIVTPVTTPSLLRSLRRLPLLSPAAQEGIFYKKMQNALPAIKQHRAFKNATHKLFIQLLLLLLLLRVSSASSFLQYLLSELS